MFHSEFKNNKDLILGVIISLSLGDQVPSFYNFIQLIVVVYWRESRKSQGHNDIEDRAETKVVSQEPRRIDSVLLYVIQFFLTSFKLLSVPQVSVYGQHASNNVLMLTINCSQPGISQAKMSNLCIMLKEYSPLPLGHSCSLL